MPGRAVDPTVRRLRWHPRVRRREPPDGGVETGAHLDRALSQRKTSASTSACQDASMTLACTPTVVHSRPPRAEETSTLVMESVPALPARMRTL